MEVGSSAGAVEDQPPSPSPGPFALGGHRANAFTLAMKERQPRAGQRYGQFRATFRDLHRFLRRPTPAWGQSLTITEASCIIKAPDSDDEDESDAFSSDDEDPFHSTTGNLKFNFLGNDRLLWEYAQSLVDAGLIDSFCSVDSWNLHRGIDHLL